MDSSSTDCEFPCEAFCIFGSLQWNPLEDWNRKRRFFISLMVGADGDVDVDEDAEVKDAVMARAADFLAFVMRCAFIRFTSQSF